MSGFSVDPLALGRPADRAADLAAELVAVSSAVAALAGTDTGDPSARLPDVLMQLGGSVRGLAEDAHRDAMALRLAGTTYAVADLRSAGRLACG